MLRKLSLIGLCAIALGVATLEISAAMTNHHKAVSKLFGSHSMHARAKYDSCLMNGASCRKFQVVVTHAAPNRTLAVRVNNHTVGTVRTNSSGRGKLDVRTAAFIGNSGAHAMSSQFPNVHRGSRIKVGAARGVFFDGMDDGVQDYEVQGDFSDGQATYTEEMDDGVIDRRFEVELSNATPGESLDIAVNGEVVGIATADENGDVHFILRSSASCDDDEDIAQPMPDSFPTLQPGDLVSVGGESTTMSLNSENGGDEQDGDNQGGDDGNDDDGNGDGGGD